MSPFLSLGFALVGLAFSGFSFSVTDCHRILQRDTSEAYCPLKFHDLRKLVIQGGRRPAFRNIPTQCHYILEGIRLVCSEYLRTDGCFLPPSTTSKACWESYQSLIGNFLHGFDIQTACGYHPEWISKGCMNMTSKREFESLIPESKLQEVKLYCNQSLENSSACELCTKSLLSLGDSYLHGLESANVSLDFALQASNTKQHTIVLSGAMIGRLVGFFGACSAVWFLWMRQKKCIRKKTNFAKDETSLILGLGSINGSTNLVKFKYEDIKKATMKFSRENLIGIGGYGNVYKGILPDGSQVAFKRFRNCSVAGDAAFAHEVEVIASFSHVNIVSLRGYCSTTVPLEGHQRIIVCDFMHNGSLYDHLFGSEVKKLSWPIRQKIVLGTARGLAYLHMEPNQLSSTGISRPVTYFWMRNLSQN